MDADNDPIVISDESDSDSSSSSSSNNEAQTKKRKSDLISDVIEIKKKISITKTIQKKPRKPKTPQPKDDTQDKPKIKRKKGDYSSHKMLSFSIGGKIYKISREKLEKVYGNENMNFLLKNALQTNMKKEEGAKNSIEIPNIDADYFGIIMEWIRIKTAPSQTVTPSPLEFMGKRIIKCFMDNKVTKYQSQENIKATYSVTDENGIESVQELPDVPILYIALEFMETSEPIGATDLSEACEYIISLFREENIIVDNKHNTAEFDYQRKLILISSNQSKLVNLPPNSIAPYLQTWIESIGDYRIWQETILDPDPILPKDDGNRFIDMRSFTIKHKTPTVIREFDKLPDIIFELRKDFNQWFDKHIKEDHWDFLHYDGHGCLSQYNFWEIIKEEFLNENRKHYIKMYGSDDNLKLYIERLSDLINHLEINPNNPVTILSVIRDIPLFEGWDNDFIFTASIIKRSLTKTFDGDKKKILETLYTCLVYDYAGCFSLCTYYYGLCIPDIISSFYDDFIECKMHNYDTICDFSWLPTKYKCNSLYAWHHKWKTVDIIKDDNELQLALKSGTSLRLGVPLSSIEGNNIPTLSKELIERLMTRWNITKIKLAELAALKHKTQTLSFEICNDLKD
jgi:hypothetical protein